MKINGTCCLFRCLPYLCLLLPIGTFHALGQTLDESKAIRVKAAYLYSFSKFVTWPEGKFENRESPIVLGLLGDNADHFKELLDSVAQTRGLIQGRPLIIHNIEYVPPVEEGSPSADREAFEEQIRSCHLFFLERSSKRMRKDIFSLVDSHRILSVGGGDGFVRSGGMVALVRKGESIIFQINVDSVDQEHLTISPKLLKNAEIIR